MADNGIRRLALSKATHAKYGSGKSNPKKAKIIADTVAIKTGTLKSGAKKMNKMATAGKLRNGPGHSFKVI